MLTASRAVHVSAKGEDPLPRVDWMADLYDLAGTGPKRGQVTMVSGPPGSMKSLFAHCWLAATGVRQLVFSADQSAGETLVRLACMVSGHGRHTVERAFRDGDDLVYREQLKAYDVVYDFEPAPGLDSFEEAINAYVEANDQYPEAILVDSLYNVYNEAGDDSEHVGQESVLKFLQEVARATGAAVVITHHLSESVKDVTVPGPRSAIIGKVSKVPESIYTVAFDSDAGLFRIAPVKTRGGKANPTGSMYATMKVDPDVSRFSRYNPATAGFWGAVE